MKRQQFKPILVSAFCALLAIAATSDAQTTATHSSTTKKTAASSKTTKTSTPAIDLNSASMADLMKLPGMTDADAQKIISARPYKSKDELVQKKIVTATLYAGFKNQVVAKPVKK